MKGTKLTEESVAERKKLQMLKKWVIPSWRNRTLPDRISPANKKTSEPSRSNNFLHIPQPRSTWCRWQFSPLRRGCAAPFSRDLPQPQDIPVSEVAFGPLQDTHSCISQIWSRSERTQHLGNDSKMHLYSTPTTEHNQTIRPQGCNLTYRFSRFIKQEILHLQLMTFNPYVL